jgi:hypothetical protein
MSDDTGRVNLLVGAHDRGFIVDGSEANGPMAQLIQEIVERHPEKV